MDATAGPFTDEQVARAEQLLGQAPFAYLAMIEPEGPYLVPLNFVYLSGGLSAPPDAPPRDPPLCGLPLGDAPLPSPVRLGGRIYFHTGEGRKTASLAADPRVCLAVTGQVGFEQGETPCADGFSYRSLLLWGRARPLEGESLRKLGLRAIVAKYDPGAAEAPFDEADLAQTLVYEMTIDAASYKERPGPAR
jgi:nitroimidazol reductase NimA-like FMN-containing flavoprotein (pyridoxamine 5'-phosphate oxidase superfamily)